MIRAVYMKVFRRRTFCIMYLLPLHLRLFLPYYVPLPLSHTHCCSISLLHLVILCLPLNNCLFLRCSLLTSCLFLVLPHPFQVRFNLLLCHRFSSIFTQLSLLTSSKHVSSISQSISSGLQSSPISNSRYVVYYIRCAAP